jgi:N-acetylneuraminate synthase
MMNVPVFVAEFTTNHLGNLNLLLRMVDRAAGAGCTRIKMQKKDVATFYAPEKLSAPYLSPYGSNYLDYRSLFEFQREDFQRFDAHCRQGSVPWFATVQDLPSLDFMLAFDLPAYKIASSNARSLALLGEMAARIGRDKEIVLSVGGSTLDQIEAALKVFCRHRLIWLLHCVAEYPCRPEHLRLGNLAVLRQRFASGQVRIGYSGHERGIVPSLAAVALGAEMVERHFCLSRHSFAHHIECSLEPTEFAQLVATATRRGSREVCCAALPPEAFASSFGMSAAERAFLVDQTYGQAFLGDQSGFAGRGRSGCRLGRRSRAAPGAAAPGVTTLPLAPHRGRAGVRGLT